MHYETSSVAFAGYYDDARLYERAEGGGVQEEGSFPLNQMRNLAYLNIPHCPSGPYSCHVVTNSPNGY